MCSSSIYFFFLLQPSGHDKSCDAGFIFAINRLYNIQATISAFWLVKSMSINPKSVQKSEIECKKVKLSAKKWNWVQNGEIKMIDSSYFELGQTKWRTKIKQRLKLFI